MEAATEVKKTVIRPDTSKMVKAKGGSFHKDDFIGNTLSGLSVDQVKVIATEMGLDVEKYAHLNPGQIRMTLGNALRKLANVTEEDGTDANRARIEDLADGMKRANEEAAEAKAAEKADAAAAKAEADAAKPKKAKKAAKVGDDANGEGNGE